MENESVAVTVIMPVYNCEKYIKEAIDSVLNQTYRNFEFLIINDGSNDSTENIILQYDDKRIRYIKNDRNIGLIETLNRGLELVCSKYIVRMDADDICHPKRLYYQVRYMDKHPDIAVLGTRAIHFSDSKVLKKTKSITKSQIIKSRLLFTCALVHPSVIIRNNIIKIGDYKYNSNHTSVEDFGLWQRISFSFPIANLKKILLYYRINDDGISSNAKKNLSEWDQSHKKIYAQSFDYLGINYSDEILNVYRKYLTNRTRLIDYELSILSHLLFEILDKAKIKNYEIKVIKKYFQFCFINNCLTNEVKLNDLDKLYGKYFLVFSFGIFQKLKYIYKYSKLMIRKKHVL